MKLLCSVLCLMVLSLPSCAQQDMNMESYTPKSTLVVPEHLIKKAKYPFVDVHNHQWGMPNQNLSSLLSDMNLLNMQVMVNLSGRGGDIFHDNYGGNTFNEGGLSHLNGVLSNVKANGRGRLLVFTNIDFGGIDNPDWTKHTVAALENDVRNGAAGLKIYKDLGLEVKDKNGKRLTVDDPRLDPVWEKCGELKIPVGVYAIVITCMLVSAAHAVKIHKQSIASWLMAGAFLFVLSD